MDPGTSNIWQDFITQESEEQSNSKAKSGDNGQDAAMNAAPIEENIAQEMSKITSSSDAENNIVGCRISHFWKEDNGNIFHWKATVLKKIAGSPSLYLVKYDNIDCVYGLELQNDKRKISLEVLSENVEACEDPELIHAESIIGKEVSLLFEGGCGRKDHWRGMVLGQVPVLTDFFYITYEKDPVLYMYQLLGGYKEGDLLRVPHVHGALAQNIVVEIANDLINNHTEYEKKWVFKNWKGDSPS